jgi:hypothetical protein
MNRSPHRVLSLVVFASTLLFFVSPGYAQYSRSDLVSNIKGLAAHTDTNLVNAWGIAFFPTSPIWVADEASGLSTLYSHQGKKLSLVVTIPSPSGVLGTPTGIVANGTPDFVVSKGGNSGPAFFIFDSEDGSISGWNPSVDPTNAVLATSVPGAFFTGLAIGNSGGTNFIYEADQANNVVDIFDTTFTLVASFTDLTVPPGLSAFNVQNINGQLYVVIAPGDCSDSFPFQTYAHLPTRSTRPRMVPQIKRQQGLRCSDFGSGRRARGALRRMLEFDKVDRRAVLPFFSWNTRPVGLPLVLETSV